ncbi:MAG: cysteine-rich small domain-containing protein [Proteobacteria bacterium]|nr:cysteine-rich small domain-containing protein [Pseudomonadota bacterium]MBU1595389.1 cysteine-rich small domain-containing protein [Pseudomonadota bacterium]
MNERFKHFQNAACEYFPCHKGPGGEEMAPATFNCLFCYCPLYFLRDCGGSPGWRGLVKDCTGCALPHAPGGWEAVQARLGKAFADLREGRAPETLGPAG